MRILIILLNASQNTRPMRASRAEGIEASSSGFEAGRLTGLCAAKVTGAKQLGAEQGVERNSPAN